MFIPNSVGYDPRADPNPYDMDSYLNDYTATTDINKGAERRKAFIDTMYPFAKPFLAQGYTALAAGNRGAAAFFSHLNSIEEYVIAATGTENLRGTLFDTLEELARKEADHWRGRAEEVGIGFVDEIVGEAVGGFVPGVTQFALDVASGFTFPYMSGAYEAYEEGESPFVGGMLNAAKTATLDGLFKMMRPLKQYLRAPAFGTVFGLEEAEVAPEGEKAKAFAKGAAIGAAYSVTSPGGRMGLKEVSEVTRAALDRMGQKGEFVVHHGSPYMFERFSSEKIGTGLQIFKDALDVLKNQRGSFSTRQKRPRKFLRTISEAKEIDPTVRERVKEIEPPDYIVQPNAESLASARNRIETQGVAEARKYLESETEFNAEKGATFYHMIRDAQRRGDYDREIELIELADRQLREAGRFIQTASLWTRIGSAPGFIKWANNQLQRTSERYGWTDTLLGTKPKEFSLNKEEQRYVFERFREIKKMETEIERTDATLELIDMVAQKVPPGVSEWIDAYRYGNMLSGPKTQMRNISENIGNTFLTRPIDTISLGAIDFIKSGLTGKEREAYVRDVALYYKAAINAVPNAVEAFSRAAKFSAGSTIGKPDLGIEARTEFDLARARQLPKALTAVQRFMEGADKFNMALISAGEMARLMRRGVPEAEAHHRAQELATEILYRQEIDPTTLSYGARALNSLGKLVEFSRRQKVIGPLSKWYIPFLRTPINRAIQMIERSPASLVRNPKSFRDAEVQARLLSGAIISSLAGLYAYYGDTTWAPPSNQKLKEQFYATGRKPYSLRVPVPGVGDQWVPLWYFGPYALAFGMGAAAKYYMGDEGKQAAKDGPDKLLGLVEGLAQFVGSQSSTQSIGALFSALHGDIDYRFSSQSGFTVQQIIPASGFVRWINQAIDPVYRKPKGFVEGIEANLPFLSQNIEPHRDPRGNIALRRGVNLWLPYDLGEPDERFEKSYERELRKQTGKAKRKKIKRTLEERREEQNKKLTRMLDDLKAGKITFEESMQQYFEAGEE